MKAVPFARALMRPPAAPLRLVAALLGRLLYRLCIGRWPDGAQARLFGAGLRDAAAPMPPVCRAMLNVPAARAQLSQMVLADLVRSGVIGGAQPARVGNPLAFWQGPPIAFLHLEKTAGLSLAALLTALFHPAQIDPDPARAVPPHLARPFAGRAIVPIRRRALVYGHYDLPALQRLDPARVVVTLLREPAARLLSLYYYWRSMALDAVPPDGAFAAVALAHRHGLLAFLTSDDPVLRDHVDNVYVRRLTGRYAAGAAADPLAVAPDAALAAALKGLRRIDFVGITERMPDSVGALGAYLGFVPPAVIPQENTAAANAAGGGVFRAVPHETLTAAHRRQLERLTRLDAVIYRVACDRLAHHAGQPAPLPSGQLVAG